MPYNNKVAINTQPLKGFRDFLPEDAQKRAWLRQIMIKVFESWGYEPLETPTLESLEIFEGQIGEDEQNFYKFEDRGGRRVTLRYDQTVPTSRVIGNYSNQIVFPFRRYQIQPAFRAENPQSGRFREFTQSDIDIFGVLSPLADAEIIAVTLELYKKLGFKKVAALINNRDLLRDIPYPALASIDKLKKIGIEGVIGDMQTKGISTKKATEYIKKIESLKPDSSIKAIFKYLENYGIDKSWYRFEPTLARALSYSQGPIWEIEISGYSAGSVGGGERYDDLVEKIGGVKIPGTGIGIGFDRTLEAVEQFGLLPENLRVTEVLVTVFSDELFAGSIIFAKKLRGKGVNTEVYPDPSVKLNKQLKYADRKGIPYVAIIGPDEAKSNLVTLKNLTNNVQETLTPDQVITKLTNE